jgi:hypothetical protein
MATTTADRPTATRRRAGDDRPVAKGADLTVLTAIREFKREAEMARRTRMKKNERNRRAFLEEQDWSHKIKGQSREFLPKTSMATEQFANFTKRALVAFGDWFQVDVPPNGPLSAEQIRRLLLSMLADCGPKMETGDRMPFPVIVSDCLKSGILEAIVVLKVHGCTVDERRFVAERGLKGLEREGQLYPEVTESLKTKNVPRWRLLIDLVRTRDWFPDPTGRGLYTIHEVERDLSDVIEWAEAGTYDPDAVERIEEDFSQLEYEAERARSRNQDQATPPAFRKRVVIDEFWGAVLDSRGRMVHANCVAAVANDRYLIRPPEDNPFWHGESPFVAAPIIRVPGSVWHKALADPMVDLNLAMNELYNLMADGGLASVWGTRQLRTDWLDDASVRTIADGIPQGTTLQVKAEMPVGAKVLETVTTGEVPKDAAMMFQVTDREFQSASLSNDLALGQLPAKQVKATEIVSADQSKAVTVDGIMTDVENMLIAPTLRKAWLTILQYAEDLPTDEVIAAVGARGALQLARMSPAARFAQYASACQFKVFGLSAMLTRAREFQKLSAMMALTSSNPVFLQVFLKEYSPSKTFAYLLKTLNIDPDNLRMTPDEQAQLPQTMQELPQFQALAGVKQQGGSGITPPESGGDTSLPAEINQQQTNPLADLGA